MSLENRTEDGESSQINSTVNEFPRSTKVLVVDPSSTTLSGMRKIMNKYSFQVATYGDAKKALTFLRKGKQEINIVIWDFHMPGIDGLQALDIIGRKMDLPVVIISDDEQTESVMQAMVHGACDYLIKPVRKETLGNIWQHIVRKRMMSKSGMMSKRMGPVQSESVESNGLHPNNCDSRSVSPYSGVQNIDTERVNEPKIRMQWTKDLREEFLKAVDILGGARSATPKELLKLLKPMKIQGITRRKVSSHLQKYRLSVEGKNNPEQVQEDGWPSASTNPPLFGLNNVHTGTSSLINGQATYPVQENQYQNDYLELNNNNEFMTNTMPRLSYDLDHDNHFQQQKQQQLNYVMGLNEPQHASGINELTNTMPPLPDDLDNPQQQFERQHNQLPHQLNNAMIKNEPEQASVIDLTGDDSIYPSLPYDPNVYNFNGYNFNL